MQYAYEMQPIKTTFGSKSNWFCTIYQMLTELIEKRTLHHSFENWFEKTLDSYLYENDWTCIFVMLTKKCVYVFVLTFFYKNKIENPKKNKEK